MLQGDATPGARLADGELEPPVEEPLDEPLEDVAGVLVAAGEDVAD